MAQRVPPELAATTSCGDPAVSSAPCAPATLDVDALAKYLEAKARDGVVALPEVGRLDFEPGATIPAQP